MIPEVSIIFPVYNADPFLRAAMDSILGQTFTNFEVIVLNDGSTDKSEELILSYVDSRIKYHHQQNSGVAAALNKAVSLAAGRYLWRHDADDISLPEKLATQVSFLNDHPDVALCACQVAFMTENGKVAWNFRQPNDKSFAAKTVMEVTREKFNPYSPVTHGTVLMRSEVMRELGGYRAEFVTGEDIDLWLRLIQHHRAVVLHQCLSLHRLSSSSATQVHGWKNKFFRELAFEYYDQRMALGTDDLQRGKAIVLPQTPVRKESVVNPPGKNYRHDILSYLYPLHLNAGDYATSLKMIRHAVRDGWKNSQTWKKIFFPIIGKKNISKLVSVKKTLKR